MAKKNKSKKEKIRYVDDGRTIADMSNVSGRRFSVRKSDVPSGSTWKERKQTYFAAVRMMFGPMLTVVVALGVIYLLVWLLFFLLA